jgi:hypothetical protein
MDINPYLKLILQSGKIRKKIPEINYPGTESGKEVS